MRLAVFDIDGTLLTGASTERRFYLQLLRRGWQGPRQLLAAAWFLIRWLPVYGRHVFKKNKAYLAWLPQEQVARLAHSWAATALDGTWNRLALDRLRRHQADGDRVLLLSGTPDFLAAAIADQLGVTEYLGSRCELRAGRFGRRPPLRHPFGAEKLKLVRELCARSGLGPADVVAYGDSIHDLDLLAWSGQPVAVRPDAALEAEARSSGWEVLGHRDAGTPGPNTLSANRG
jgi:HAD superfamily phosphoserine phosphatase-like hydrolase